MSEFSSVRTSRVQSIAAKSMIYSQAHSSAMSRISSKISSVPTSKITGISQATSHLTEILSSKINIDEYGFTDKACRNCSNLLSIEEVIALTIPLDHNGVPLCKVEDINYETISLICLSCYADIVSKKNKNNGLESIKEIVPLAKSVKNENKKENKEKIEEIKPKVEEKPGSNYSKARSKSNNSKQSYRKVARPVMPFASDPTKFYENIRRDKFYRKKTDLTQFANATFQGGVFVNGFPGQSI